jgi:hypothetical protein
MLIDCRLAEAADFGHKAPMWLCNPCRRRFRSEKGQFSPQKITVVTLENNLHDGITRILFFIFFEFLAASDAMVADESGVRRWDSRAKIPALLKLNTNLVPTSSKSTQNFFCYFVSHTGLEQVLVTLGLSPITQLI